MGVTLEEAREAKQNGEEIHDRIREAVDLMNNPDRAVREMQESRKYEGQLFRPKEITEYIRSKVSVAESRNPRTEGPDERNESLRELMQYAVGERPKGYDQQANMFAEMLKDAEGIAVEGIKGEEYFTTKEVSDQIYE